MRVHGFGYCPQVGDTQQRVGWRLEPDQARLRGKCFCHILRIGCVDEVEVQSEGTENLIEKSICPAVDIISGQHVIAGLQHLQHCGGGS